MNATTRIFPWHLGQARGLTSYIFFGSGATSFFENKEETTFDLSTANRSVRLAVDPGYDLFRRLVREEIQPTVNSIRGSTSLLAVVTGDPSTDDLKTVRTLLAGLSHPETHILREANTVPQQLKAHDILYFAIAGRKGHLPAPFI